MLRELYNPEKHLWYPLRPLKAGVHPQICPSSGLPCDCGAAATVAPGGMIATDSEDKLKFGGAAAASKPSREPIFPSELRSRVAQPLELPGKLATWYR